MNPREVKNLRQQAIGKKASRTKLRDLRASFCSPNRIKGKGVA